MKVKVTYADGKSATAPVSPRAQVAIERRFDVLFTDIFDQDLGKARVEHWYFMGLAALKFDGHPSVKDIDLDDVAAFDAWLSTVKDAEPVTEGRKTKTPPTRKAPKRGSSSG